MIHNYSRLLKESMDIPIQLDRVCRPNPFQAVKKPNDDDLARQEIPSSEYAAAPIVTGLKDTYVTGIESPSTEDIVCQDCRSFVNV
ncbi:hypothetical protein [Mesorhizobium argentiipisi]|uniref:Uncharacterized protein n=1 Tax=Mesorhizobium argentiipisi TaxID=3015175 RepID=A0ABU8K8D4_9HYPH